MDRAAIHAAVVGATTTRPCPTRIPPCNMQRGQVPGQNTLTLGATGSYRRAPADRAVASRPDGGPTGRRRENEARGDHDSELDTDDSAAHASR